MDQQQAANGGAAAEFATEAAAPGDVLNGGQGQSTGTTSPTNNGLNNNEAKRAIYLIFVIFLQKQIFCLSFPKCISFQKHEKIPT